MSPELIIPEKFGYKTSRLTKSSDCYALGMVIYETVGGNTPFHEHTDVAASIQVILGQHPTRGEMFPDHLWGMMELCWTPQPDDRPRITDVLQCLKKTSSSSESPSNGPSAIQMGTSDTTLTLDLGYATIDHGPAAVSHPPRPVTTEAADKPEVDTTKRTYSNLSISLADLDEGGTYKVSTTYSHNLILQATRHVAGFPPFACRSCSSTYQEAPPLVTPVTTAFTWNFEISTRRRQRRAAYTTHSAACLQCGPRTRTGHRGLRDQD